MGEDLVDSMVMVEREIYFYKVFIKDYVMFIVFMIRCDVNWLEFGRKWWEIYLII